MTGVQTCALPIYSSHLREDGPKVCCLAMGGGGVCRGSASVAAPALGWVLTRHPRATAVSGTFKLGSDPFCCHLDLGFLVQSPSYQEILHNFSSTGLGMGGKGDIPSCTEFSFFIQSYIIF